MKNKIFKNKEKIMRAYINNNLFKKKNKMEN